MLRGTARHGTERTKPARHQSGTGKIHLRVLLMTCFGPSRIGHPPLPAWPKHPSRNIEMKTKPNNDTTIQYIIHFIFPLSVFLCWYLSLLSERSLATLLRQHFTAKATYVIKKRFDSRYSATGAAIVHSKFLSVAHQGRRTQCACVVRPWLVAFVLGCLLRLDQFVGKAGSTKRSLHGQGFFVERSDRRACVMRSWQSWLGAPLWAFLVAL